MSGRSASSERGGRARRRCPRRARRRGRAGRTSSSQAAAAAASSYWRSTLSARTSTGRRPASSKPPRGTPAAAGRPRPRPRPPARGRSPGRRTRTSVRTSASRSASSTVVTGGRRSRGRPPAGPPRRAAAGLGRRRSSGRRGAAGSASSCPGWAGRARGPGRRRAAGALRADPESATRPGPCGRSRRRSPVRRVVPAALAVQVRRALAGLDHPAPRRPGPGAGRGGRPADRAAADAVRCAPTRRGGRCCWSAAAATWWSPTTACRRDGRARPHPRRRGRAAATAHVTRRGRRAWDASSARAVGGRAGSASRPLSGIPGRSARPRPERRRLRPGGRRDRSPRCACWDRDDRRDPHLRRRRLRLRLPHQPVQARPRPVRRARRRPSSSRLGRPVRARSRYAELARTLGVEVGDAGARWPTCARRCWRCAAARAWCSTPADHDTWSAGSFFTNPVLVAEPRPPAAGRRRRAGPPARRARSRPRAAWLIEHAGFGKGYGTRPGRARPASTRSRSPTAAAAARPTCSRWPARSATGSRPASACSWARADAGRGGAVSAARGG